MQNKLQEAHLRLKAQASREPEYVDIVDEAVEEMVELRDRTAGKLDSHGPDCECIIKPVRLCLGPGRCELLDAHEGCKWCMRFPDGEGVDYVDTFLAIHERGH
jgi:chorismate synthase